METRAGPRTAATRPSIRRSERWHLLGGARRASQTTRPPPHRPATASSAQRPLRLLCAFDQFPEMFAFRRVEVLVFEHVQHEQARRSVEEAPDQMAQRTTPRLTLVDHRLIDEGAGDLVVRHIALLFEDSEHRLDGAVANGTGLVP